MNNSSSSSSGCSSCQQPFQVLWRSSCRWRWHFTLARLRPVAKNQQEQQHTKAVSSSFTVEIVGGAGGAGGGGAAAAVGYPNVDAVGQVDENKLNSSSWEDTLTEPQEQHPQSQSQLPLQSHSESLSVAQAQHQTSSFITAPGQGVGSQKASLTTAQLQSAFSRRIAEQQQQRAKGGQISQQADSATIAGGSFSANGGQAAVGVGVVGVGVGSSASSSSERDTKSPGRERREPPTASHSDEENFTEEEQTSSSVSSLSAGNQRNSQLRSTFNKAKQHLSFDKWRTAASASSSSATPNSLSGQPQCSQSVGPNSSRDSNMIMRRASACTMPTGSGAAGGVSQREDNTAPGESPGGRLSRWFSIRRGSSHQYDVGGRDGRQLTGSSFDMPDASASAAAAPKPTAANATLDAASPQKLANLGASKMMPGVPEYEDDENSAPENNRFDMDLMIPPGSRANGTARTTHSRLIVPMLPPAPPGLSQQQLKRRHIVAAIVHSENSYVATLQRLVNVSERETRACIRWCWVRAPRTLNLSIRTSTIVVQDWGHRYRFG
ncbi:hypothetical protein AWZ03_010885 [Drosophila navojoa]|uniref:DH domain-containing protein n=1 Tax=Drosophila navojoa TaxID=7232 RepID=A0A484B4E9_DRONA|nr:hypothetical protein AWZ03_010885 [Drosophila navojoa]